jgi:hypothetical protein
MKDGRQSDKDIFGIFSGQGIRSRFLTGRPGSMGSGAGFFEKCGDFWFECREIIRDDTPDDLPVYLEITMDHLVSHAGNLPLF